MTQTIIFKKNLLKRLKRTLFLRFVIIAIFPIGLSYNYGCANMQRPTGGPKDSIPPKVLNISPQNFLTNFKEKDIVVTFDEFIKINNQFKEFSISPDTDIPPQYKVKKKNLHITLPDSLEENSTYTLNFGNGLVDYNEGNILKNFTYVFATGDELDSLNISGKVLDGYKKEFNYQEDKDVKVILIPTKQDSIFGKKKANIFTTVDSSGNFRIANLKEGTYRIYALKEQDNDRIYNNPNEYIGFIKDSIVLTKDTSNISLEYTKGYPLDFRTIERKIDTKGFVLFTFNKSLENGSVKLLDNPDLDKTKITKWGSQKDTAKLYLENFDFDSVKFEIRDDNTILDTILIRKSRNFKIERFSNPTLSIGNKVDKVKHIKISSDFPIDNLDKSKIFLKEDSTDRRNFSLIKDTLVSNIYHLKYNWKPKKNYELTFEEKAIQGAFDVYNEESKSTFTLDESDNYGNIFFDVKGLDTLEQYIIEIIDEKKENVYDKRILKGDELESINYTDFPAGKYSIRVVWDQNKNEKWDPGNVYENKQAEPIWYLDRVFTIRAGWEQNEEISVTFPE